MLYRPLFLTSFWAEDWLFIAPAMPYNGAAAILVLSASTKTTFCLTYLVQKRNQPGVTVIGLTSKRNLAFTKGLGLYATVHTYDDVEQGLAAARQRCMQTLQEMRPCTHAYVKCWDLAWCGTSV